MIDAHAVDFGEQAVEPRVEESEHGSRPSAVSTRLDVPTRIETGYPTAGPLGSSGSAVRPCGSARGTAPGDTTRPPAQSPIGRSPKSRSQRSAAVVVNIRLLVGDELGEPEERDRLGMAARIAFARAAAASPSTRQSRASGPLSAGLFPARRRRSRTPPPKPRRLVAPEPVGVASSNTLLGGETPDGRTARRRRARGTPSSVHGRAYERPRRRPHARARRVIGRRPPLRARRPVGALPTRGPRRAAPSRSTARFSETLLLDMATDRRSASVRPGRAAGR
jgi:hypothetical protein